MEYTARDKEICIKCGLCCNYATFNLPISYCSEEGRLHTEYYKARGFDIFYNSSENYIAIRIYSPCPNLVLEQGCKVYEYRPELCRLYDGKKDPFINCPLKNS